MKKNNFFYGYVTRYIISLWTCCHPDLPEWRDIYHSARRPRLELWLCAERVCNRVFCHGSSKWWHQLWIPCVSPDPRLGRHRLGNRLSSWCCWNGQREMSACGWRHLWQSVCSQGGRWYASRLGGLLGHQEHYLQRILKVTIKWKVYTPCSSPSKPIVDSSSNEPIFETLFSLSPSIDSDLKTLHAHVVFSGVVSMVIALLGGARA